MATIKLITDGRCDLPNYLTEKLEVTIVPLSVQLGSEQLTSDMDTDVFYEKLKRVKELPKTSSPLPNDFMQSFKEVGPSRDILVARFLQVSACW